MRAGKQPPEGEAQERYLGAIAPLLATARQLEMLSPDEQRQVRKRILRTLFGTRSIRLRGRLLPVLVVLALLVVGGAAFATAQRLGFLPGLDRPEAEPPARPAEAHKRKKPRGRPRAARAPATLPESAVSPGSPPVALPEIPPRPLLTLPPSGVLQPTGAQAPAATAGTAVAAPAPIPSIPKPAGRRGGRRAMSASPFPAAASWDRPAPVIPAPPEQPAAPVMPGPPVAAVPAAPPFVLPAAPVLPAPAPAAPVVPSSSPPPAPPAAAVIPASPPSAPAAAKPPPAAAPPAMPATPPTEAAKSPLTDQALFGRALRKLRAEHDAAGALAALREHGKAFPASTLAGERKALEVEALLALHRDREALALLDTVALDELPRSGERLVVRGELRAAAKRWPEAHGDFDRALARVSGSPAWHERALWGRGVARLRLGEREAGLADIERYRDTYPKGRFAAEAAKFFPNR